MSAPGGPLLRAAAVQMDVRLGENETNLARVLERLQEAASQGAQLIVFPECALSGYCFGSATEAMPFAESVESERIPEFAGTCERLGVTGVLGFLETDGESLYNSVAVVTSGIGTWTYRKNHLPTLGVDRFVKPGNELAAQHVHCGACEALGALICYDVRFPEAARVLALQGAEVIALPTNWPEGAESSPEFITRTRAWENRVFIVAADRVGIERGRRFIGRSQIVAPSGEILCEAGADEETILYAHLDLAEARRKRIVNEPGEWEMDITGDRRPELYRTLIES